MLRVAFRSPPFRTPTVPLPFFCTFCFISSLDEKNWRCIFPSSVCFPTLAKSSPLFIKKESKFKKTYFKTILRPRRKPWNTQVELFPSIDPLNRCFRNYHPSPTKPDRSIFIQWFLFGAVCFLSERKIHNRPGNCRKIPIAHTLITYRRSWVTADTFALDVCIPGEALQNEGNNSCGWIYIVSRFESQIRTITQWVRWTIILYLTRCL